MRVAINFYSSATLHKIAECGYCDCRKGSPLVSSSMSEFVVEVTEVFSTSLLTVLRLDGGSIKAGQCNVYITVNLLEKLHAYIKKRKLFTRVSLTLGSMSMPAKLASSRYCRPVH